MKGGMPPCNNRFNKVINNRFNKAMKEIQKEKLLNGRKAYISPFTIVHKVNYEYALLEASVVGLDNQPGDALNSGGAGSDNTGGSAGEVGDDTPINNAKSWGGVWEED